jgi:hypothetical protein
MDAVRAKIELKMPEKLWLAAVSKHHKDSTFHLLSFLPTKELIGNTLIKIDGDDVERILKEIKEHPSLIELSILSQQKNSAVINTRTKDPWLLSAMMKSEVLLKPPVKVKDGVAEWVALSTRDRISVLMGLLDEKGISYRLKSIGEYSERPVLTERQAKLLDFALKLGYYEVPRKITLAQLARKLGVSKSTLSETLRAAEKRLIKYKS